MLENYYKTLESNPLFSQLDDYSLDELLGCLRPKVKTYEKNEIIALAGEPFTNLGIVLEGQVHVLKESATGAKLIMSTLEPGEMFGEMIAFSGRSKWAATVQATKKSVVLFMESDTIVGQCNRMCSWHKTLIQNMLKIVSNRALYLNQKVEYLSIKSMRGKLAKFFVEESEHKSSLKFELNINRNEMADFLNVSRPSMSREMGKMKEEGLIDYKRNQVEILDLETLEVLAE
ncbi:MAG TPA: transcriptional regulator [Eubacteriaceae bacterium]|nr:transcriptional regulator [Eubacteriaceae bacterium]